MTIQQLNYVITISEIGSLNKASQVLYVSQPSLSGSVRELEKELGITIFIRSGRGVKLTAEGEEFVQNARAVVQQYGALAEKYAPGSTVKKKFGVSAQHYSFAVKSFVEMVKHFDTAQYDFAIRETRTLDVINDVSSSKSEIGILFLSEFNRKAMEKILGSAGLEFHRLVSCSAYVYLWRGHPLAGKSSIRFGELADYPCLSFEQDAGGSFYFAEEIMSTSEYPRTIKATDRATMLNLMVGLNGYTLCSGIICRELNGPEYVAVPFETEGDPSAGRMEIGYVVKKNTVPSRMGELYLKEIKRYLEEQVVETPHAIG